MVEFNRQKMYNLKCAAVESSSYNFFFLKKYYWFTSISYTYFISRPSLILKIIKTWFVVKRGQTINIEWWWWGHHHHKGTYIPTPLVCPLPRSIPLSTSIERIFHLQIINPGLPRLLINYVLRKHWLLLDRARRNLPARVVVPPPPSQYLRGIFILCSLFQFSRLTYVVFV